MRCESYAVAKSQTSLAVIIIIFFCWTVILGEGRINRKIQIKVAIIVWHFYVYRSYFLFISVFSIAFL